MENSNEMISYTDDGLKKIYLTDEERDCLVMEYGYQVSYDDYGCYITSL